MTDTKCHPEIFKWPQLEDIAEVEAQYVFRWDFPVVPASNNFRFLISLRLPGPIDGCSSPKTDYITVLMDYPLDIYRAQDIPSKSILLVTKLLD